MSTQEDLFHPVVELPEPVRQARYDRLVGLDDTKLVLRKEASLLADPELLQKWATQHHKGRPAALTLFNDRAPLFVFGGDVGAGKTALAESFGCDLSDHLGVPVFLYRLKISTRGSGLVGEMTTLIGDAFAHLYTEGKKARTSRGVKSVLVLVVDEADALAQSREAQQMHHEDRAGVDALLSGVDSLAGANLPVLVILCTNRASSLDPAVVRRAAAVFNFGRPNADQRREVLTAALEGLDVKARMIDELVRVTGSQEGRIGYSFSDLTQRLVPAAVMEAYPDRPVTGELLVGVALRLKPTPAFAEQGVPTVDLVAGDKPAVERRSRA